MEAPQTFWKHFKQYLEELGLTREYLAEKLREELGWEYISKENFHHHPDKNAQFTLRGYNPYVSPVTVTFWGDANDAFERINVEDFYLVYVDGSTSLYSKRAFKYGVFGFQVKLPDPTDKAFKKLWLGAETCGAWYGGLCSFKFGIAGGAIQTVLYNVSVNRAGVLAPDISALMPVTPNEDLYLYLVKINKASVEYWVQDKLVGIVQFAPNSDTYDVRTTAPYYLGQVKGLIPAVSPALIEWDCSAEEYIGKRSNIQLQSIYVTDGDPTPPRTLHPYTEGSEWEGTSIDSGTLTSDKIPVAGYDNKTIFFLADQPGTLYIDVDYGDNSNDEYDSVSISANTLESYILTANPLWIRLRYTPSSYPCTIRRARIVMS